MVLYAQGKEETWDKIPVKKICQKTGKTGILISPRCEFPNSKDKGY